MAAQGMQTGLSVCKAAGRMGEAKWLRLGVGEDRAGNDF